MPPKSKKRSDEESKSDGPILGRPTNNVKMGIVGLPNVGKSSFFNSISKLNIPAENRPFCTIEPNDARVPVVDPRFDYLCSAFSPKSEVPAVLTVHDIAGLVAGASEGAGMGNAFLSHIAAVDGLYHMVRCFKDPDVVHVDGSVDPIRDMECIHNELRSKDLSLAEKVIEATRKSAARGGPGAKERMFEFETINKVQEWLAAGNDVRAHTWSAAEVVILNQHQFLTAKPMVYLANLSERDYIRKSNKWLPAIADFVKTRGTGDPVIPFSVEFEQSVIDASLTGPEAVAALEEEKKARSILPRIIKTGYKVLALINYFTAGADEVRAWTIRRGLKAPAAAGVIHGDFEKCFISADVYSFNDFKEHESEAAVRAAGRLRMEGKNYVVVDGDVMHFKHNAGGAGKKK